MRRIDTGSTPGRRLLIPVLALLVSAGTVMASDGAFEISPLCVATGCFTDDDPGLPVEINQPGHYVLTGTLEVASPDDEAIVVRADNVHIDLGGHSLVGPVVCSGGTPVCSLQGTGAGIVGALVVRGVKITNGKITGFGDDGIRFNANPFEVTDMHIFSNGGDGIEAISGGRFDNNMLINNGQAGIRTALTSAMTINSRVSNNGDLGVTGGICGNNVFASNAFGEQGCIAQISPNICNTTACP